MYTKARSEFGKQVRFEDAKSSLVHELAPNDIEKQKNIMINPSIARFDTHPMM
jgi:dynein intermediate chain 2, axonemal